MNSNTTKNERWESTDLSLDNGHPLHTLRRPFRRPSFDFDRCLLSSSTSSISLDSCSSTSSISLDSCSNFDRSNSFDRNSSFDKSSIVQPSPSLTIRTSRNNLLRCSTNKMVDSIGSTNSFYSFSGSKSSLTASSPLPNKNKSKNNGSGSDSGNNTTRKITSSAHLSISSVISPITNANHHQNQRRWLATAENEYEDEDEFANDKPSRWSATAENEDYASDKPICMIRRVSSTYSLIK